MQKEIRMTIYWNFAEQAANYSGCNTSYQVLNRSGYKAQNLFPLLEK